MGVLDDILKAFDRWAEWGPIRAAPSRIDGLENRVSALEHQLGGKWPADVCKYCGERAVRLYWTGGPDEKGNLHQDWRCAACKQQEKRLVKPSAG